MKQDAAAHQAKYVMLPSPSRQVPSAMPKAVCTALLLLSLFLPPSLLLLLRFTCPCCFCTSFVASVSASWDESVVANRLTVVAITEVTGAWQDLEVVSRTAVIAKSPMGIVKGALIDEDRLNAESSFM